MARPVGHGGIFTTGFWPHYSPPIIRRLPSPSDVPSRSSINLWTPKLFKLVYDQTPPEKRVTSSREWAPNEPSRKKPKNPQTPPGEPPLKQTKTPPTKTPNPKIKNRALKSPWLTRLPHAWVVAVTAPGQLPIGPSARSPGTRHCSQHHHPLAEYKAAIGKWQFFSNNVGVTDEHVCSHSRLLAWSLVLV